MDYTKVMFGQNAIHIPIWMVVMNAKTAFPFAGGTRYGDILFGSELVHTLILGDLILRPHFVVANDNFKGRDLNSFLTDNPSAKEWVTDGQVFVDTEIGREQFMKWK